MARARTWPSASTIETVAWPVGGLLTCWMPGRPLAMTRRPAVGEGAEATLGVGLGRGWAALRGWPATPQEASATAAAGSSHLIPITKVLERTGRAARYFQV